MLKLIFLLVVFCALFTSINSKATDFIHQFGEVKIKAIPKNKATAPVVDWQWNRTAKLWLARSCAGEAGFYALEECSAIAWVYATRAAESRVNFTTLVRSYSSAIRKDNRPGRRWIRGLYLDGTRPKYWPKNMDWPKHKIWWSRILALLDLWSEGRVFNPVEFANHFGGKMDIPDRKWIKIIPKSFVPFRNLFYRGR